MKSGALSNAGNVLDCPVNDEHWTILCPYMNYAYNYMPYYYAGGVWNPRVPASRCCPSELIMFADVALFNEGKPPLIGTSYCDWVYHWDNSASPSIPGSFGKGIKWCHAGGANVVYLDGHAIRRLKTDLSDKNFEPIPGYTP